jgi:peptide/nickel transport system substrate-binding protein
MNNLNSEIIVSQASVTPGDPHICSDSIDRLSIIFNIYESLITKKAGKYYPSLAKSWKVEDNAREWTFFLRKGIKFHNGDLFTANDVIATLSRVIDPTVGGAYGTQGVYASYLGSSKTIALDDATIKIVTSEPLADLLDILVAIPINSGSSISDLPEKYVGTGPYKILMMEDDETIMEANTDYWAAKQRIKKIRWKSEKDPKKRVDSLLSGEVDIASNIGLKGKKKVDTSRNSFSREMDSGLCIIFMCNAQKGLCQDKLVRQALNYALDLEKVITKIKGGAAKPLNGYLTPHHFGYDPTTPIYPYNPDKAQNLLKKAGFNNEIELTIDIPTTMPDEAPLLAELLTKQYEQVGIKATTVKHHDREAYALMVKEKKINDICCFDSSPRSTFRVLREKIHSRLKGPWWEGYTNQEVDALIDEAQMTVNDTRRQSIYRKIYRIIHDDAPWIFLYRPIIYWGLSKKTKDWLPTSDSLIIFY